MGNQLYPLFGVLSITLLDECTWHLAPDGYVWYMKT